MGFPKTARRADDSYVLRLFRTQEMVPYSAILELLMPDFIKTVLLFDNLKICNSANSWRGCPLSLILFIFHHTEEFYEYL